jgi:HAE1 family hydrophobic/amphiphilic exporter-1
LKQGEANVVMVADGVKNKLDDIKSKLPEGMDLKVIYDQSTSIKAGITDLIREGLTGAVLCFFVLYAFLGDWKTSVVVITVIPTSILITIILLFASGITINTISLAGLVVGIGLLTDGAIVIIENITRHKKEGMAFFDAAVIGTTELIGAITSSVFTSIVVFLPLVFVIGIIGQVFKDLSLSIVYTHIASLLVYFTLLPMLASMIPLSTRGEGRRTKDEGRSKRGEGRETNDEGHHTKDEGRRTKGENFIEDAASIVPANEVSGRPSSFVKEGHGRFYFSIRDNTALLYLYSNMSMLFKKVGETAKRFNEGYNYVLDWAFKNQLRTVVYAFIACVLSLILLLFLPREMFPKVDHGQFLINLRMPVGSKLSITNQTALLIESELMKIPEVEHKTTTVGSVAKEGLQPLAANEAQIVVDLKEKRRRKQDEIEQDLKSRLDKADLMGGKILFSEQGGQFSVIGGGGSPVVIEVKGYDMKTLNTISEELKAGLKEIKGVYNIDSTLKLNAMEIGIDVNRDKLASYSLSTTDLARTILTAVKGNVASKLREEGKEIDIRVQLSEKDRKNQNSLYSLLVTSPLKLDVPLAAIARIDSRLGPSEILHYDQQRTVLVTAGLFKKSIDDVRPAINKIIAGERKLHPEFSFELTGEATNLAESFNSLKIILLLSILLVYMIMAAQFESFWQPLLIMFTIPLSLIGMGPALFITGNSISVMAGIGLILLNGIVVANGIVLIDFANQEMEKGKSLKDALWSACHIRMRPIMMTAFTTVLGLMPVAIGFGKEAQMQAPMAIVVISGFLVSTCLTLVVLPTIYLLVEDKVFKRNILWHKQ